ncbi:unnamed protein product [Paramecium octaurelia]|uniref:Uncharacterized protein n=1 Tax=Paramecium octaurelia TaxID=43137 RepID=A0A8S1VNY0_PAROT|nr:unnamed protein product [Paramecium octaurelia]
MCHRTPILNFNVSYKLYTCVVKMVTLINQGEWEVWLENSKCRRSKVIFSELIAIAFRRSNLTQQQEILSSEDAFILDNLPLNQMMFGCILQQSRFPQSSDPVNNQFNSLEPDIKEV